MGGVGSRIWTVAKVAEGSKYRWKGKVEMSRLSRPPTEGPLELESAGFASVSRNVEAGI